MEIDRQMKAIIPPAQASSPPSSEMHRPDAPPSPKKGASTVSATPGSGIALPASSSVKGMSPASSFAVKSSMSAPLPSPVVPHSQLETLNHSAESASTLQAALATFNVALPRMKRKEQRSSFFSSKSIFSFLTYCFFVFFSFCSSARFAHVEKRNRSKEALKSISFTL